VRLAGAGVRGQVAERPTPHLGQRPVSPVGEAGHAQLVGDPGEEAVAGRLGAGHRRPGQWHERHDVNDSEPRVRPDMVTQVEPVDRGPGHVPGRLLADQREDRPIVVGIRMHVEQRITSGRCDGGDRVHAQAFRDVCDAFKHR
jgi:hypothetical protein